MGFYSFACKLLSGWKNYSFFPLIYSFTGKFWFWVFMQVATIIYFFSEIQNFVHFIYRASKLTEMVIYFVPWFYLSSSITLSELNRVKKWVMAVSYGSATSEDTSFPERNTNCPWHSWAKENSGIWRNPSLHQCFTGNTSWEISMHLQWRTSIFSIVFYT